MYVFLIVNALLHIDYNISMQALVKSNLRFFPVLHEEIFDTGEYSPFHNTRTINLFFFFFYFSSLLSAAAFHCISAGIRAESLISAVLALELFGLGV